LFKIAKSSGKKSFWSQNSSFYVLINPQLISEEIENCDRILPNHKVKNFHEQEKLNVSNGQPHQSPYSKGFAC
jgi:hypothetical protein